MQTRTLTLKLKPETIHKMMQFYDDFKMENTNPYVLFAARIDQCTITIFNTNKVVFQGPNSVSEASLWNDPSQKWLFTEDQGGSDEVGTGDYFGPICVCACFVPKAMIPQLDEWGVCDSKQLSDFQIAQIAPRLMEKLTYISLVLDNPKYNDLTNRGYNMNKIKAYLHNHALLQLQKKIAFPITTLVVDQFTPKEMYFRYLSDVPHVEHNIQFITKAESLSPAVAAASIIARYTFLSKMNNLNEQVGVVLPKGAGAQVDDIGRLLFQKLGIKRLSEISKINFKNTEKIKELVAREDLNDI